MSTVPSRPPRPSLHRSAAVAVLAAAALLTPAVAVATPAPSEDRAADALSALEPGLQGLVEELPAPARAEVADALVDEGEGTSVAVAVRAADGDLSVERLDVAPAEAAEVVDALEGEGPVVAASVVGTMRAVGDVVPAPAPAVTALPSTGAGAASVGPDPRRRDQWGLDALQAGRVRADATGRPVVAVVDSGVDGTHEDLAGVVLRGTDLVRRGGGDGWSDEDGHGTHVAGTVAAVVGNARGGQGVLDDVRVLPVRVLDADGAGFTDDIAEGVVWAADHGADVVNLSLGGPGRDTVLSAAIAYAVGHGVVVVAAMGNEGLEGSPVSYPAADRDVLAVTALEEDRRRAAWSSQGSHADLAAPGSSILSTVPGSRYGWSSGTSMASPHVAAAAAALAGSVPGASAADVAAALTATADDLGPRGRDAATGYGLVDPVEALALLRASTAAAPAAPQGVAVASGDRRATTSWRAPSTAGGHGRPTGYEVEVRGKGQPVQRAALGASATTWTATGLVNGQAYEVRVRATSGGGAGPWAATVVARPRTLPSAPRSPGIASGSTKTPARTVHVRWSAPSSHGGATISGYRVVLRQVGTTRDVTYAAGKGATTLGIGGLKNGVRYTAVVRAVNAAGVGPASARTGAVAAR